MVNKMNQVIESAGIKFGAESELEVWRAETLLTKEPETIAWIRQNAEMGCVFYDIGANIGTFSLFASSLNKDMKIYSFEPIENNYMTLLANKGLNNATNINPLNIALSNSNKLASIYLKDDRIGNSGAQLDKPIDEFGADFKPVGIQQVLSFRLDSLVEKYGFPKPNFIKIDVDGREKDIIDGMSNLLKSKELRSILIEFNSREEEKLLEVVFEKNSFEADPLFNELLEHSSKRRQEKNSTAVNMVFTKKEN
jgi:FkbM family methyltransferase